MDDELERDLADGPDEVDDNPEDTDPVIDADAEPTDGLDPDMSDMEDVPDE